MKLSRDISQDARKFVEALIEEKMRTHPGGVGGPRLDSLPKLLFDLSTPTDRDDMRSGLEAISQHAHLRDIGFYQMILEILKHHEHTFESIKNCLASGDGADDEGDDDEGDDDEMSED